MPLFHSDTIRPSSFTASTNAQPLSSATGPKLQLAGITRYFHSTARLERKILQQGGRIIHVGDTTSILIPIDFLFDAKDDLLRNDIFKEDHVLLDSIAAYLNTFDNSAIKIGVSSDDVGTRKRNYILTKRQAYRIAAYLWHHGVSAWRLYPAAYGPDLLLATNRTIVGSYRNRFIEITTNPYVTPAECCHQIRYFVNTNQAWQYWGLPYSYRRDAINQEP